MVRSSAARAAGLCVLVTSSTWLCAQSAATGRTYTNPLYPGADPWIVRHNDIYFLCQSGRGRTITVSRLPGLTERGEPKVVWRAPRQGWNTSQIWAPELHRIRGKWYIYYAASAGGNESHRMGVLEAATDDPQGPYIDRGMLYTGDDIVRKTRNRWAIDGTVMELKGRLYFIWSGWEDHRDVQYLYIAPMENPWTISGNRVRLCANDTYLWERVSESARERGLQEGPAVLHRNNRVFLVYSASGSWQRTYKLGLLHMDENADPLDPASWRKHPRPVFQPTAQVHGVGHCSFITSPDGREDWIAYHAKIHAHEGWERVVHLQRFTWTPDGFPEFGAPAAGVPLPAPAIEPAPTPPLPSTPPPSPAAPERPAA